jgi:hypothetical protein
MFVKKETTEQFRRQRLRWSTLRTQRSLISERFICPYWTCLSSRCDTTVVTVYYSTVHSFPALWTTTGNSCSTETSERMLSTSVAERSAYIWKYSARTVYILLTLSIFCSHCLYSAQILCIFYPFHIPSIFCVHSLYILPTFRLYYVHIQSK